MTLSMNGGFDWAPNKRTNAVCDVNEQRLLIRTQLTLQRVHTWDIHKNNTSNKCEYFRFDIGTNTRMSYRGYADHIAL